MTLGISRSVLFLMEESASRCSAWCLDTNFSCEELRASVRRLSVSAEELLVAFLIDTAIFTLNAGILSKSAGFPSVSCANCIKSGSSSLASFSVANSCSASLSSVARASEDVLLTEVSFDQEIIKVTSNLTKRKQQNNRIRF